MTYRDIARLISTRLRRRRLRGFKKLFPPDRCQRVLDLGGSPEAWEMMQYPGEITLMNLDPAMMTGQDRYIRVIGDARNLAYADRSFDLVFSNSVIEHVGGPQDALAFAREMQRVGKAFYCQTPNKWFPIEPHFGTLFLHWFPGILSNYYVFRYGTLYGWMNKPDRELVKLLARDVRLLTRKELLRLFPNAEIRCERLLLWPKSYIAMRTPQ